MLAHLAAGGGARAAKLLSAAPAHRAFVALLKVRARAPGSTRGLWGLVTLWLLSGPLLVAAFLAQAVLHVGTGCVLTARYVLALCVDVCLTQVIRRHGCPVCAVMSRAQSLLRSCAVERLYASFEAVRRGLHRCKIQL